MKLQSSFFKIIAAGALICGFVMFTANDGFAKCEQALARLKQAEAELNAANKAYDAANNAAKQAAANLAAAVGNLNAIAGKLGAQGKATAQSATFGASPSNPAFYDNPLYKAAKEAWQDAKDANEKAEGELDEAGARRKRAQDEYNDAEAEYQRLRAEHVGDEGLLREPEPLKLDEKLTEDVEKLTQDKILYDSISQDDVTSDVGLVLRKAGGKSILEVSVLSKGKGAQFRKWAPEKLTLVLASGNVKPSAASNYYVSKESAVGGAAPLIFAAIGSQYKRDAAQAEASKGKACASGAGTSTGYGGVEKAIDRGGMAAGLGLLTSQAKGEIKGLKAAFDVTGREKELGSARLKAVIANKSENKQIDVVIPISIE